MTVEFIGMIASEAKSEIHPATGPVIDPDYIARFAQAHEAAGFGRVLIAHNSSDADAVLVATHAAQNTKTINFMIAHRPGFIAPTYAARLFATFDVFSGGRGGIHIISGGDSTEQRKDGDFLNHEERYRRTDEYVGLMRQTWTAEAPFSHKGTYYQVENAFARVKPVQKPHIPVFFGGSSDIAIEFAAKHADIYAFWGETLEQARETIAQVRAACVKIGRQPESLGAGRADHRTHPRSARRQVRRAECPAGERRFQAPAGSRRRRQGARQAAMDRGGRRGRRRIQYHVAGRHAGAGGGIAAGIPGAGGDAFPDPRFRSAGRRHRLRPRPAADRAGGGGEAGGVGAWLVRSTFRA